MKTKLLSGTACAALCLLSFSGSARSATLDDVMARLDKIEKENAELRAKVRAMSAAKPAAAAPAPAAADPGKFKGNPVMHEAVATSPKPPPGPTIGGMPVKAGPLAPLVDNTTVTLYGSIDLSGDIFNPSVFDQGTKLGVSSNISSFGVRVRHNLAPYGWDGWAAVAQIESQVDFAAAPTERASFGTRDSYLGLEGPWGAIKAGKSDTPYKKATAAFDPFTRTVADYNSIMGNTGGDNRAEFDWRMNHAVWYESPIFNGFQFSALISPGQNYAKDNSDYSFGDYFQCNGASTRGSGSNFPGTGGAVAGNIGGNGCTDGSYGNAYSAALIYKNGPFTGIAAYELHEQVNRHGDDGLQPTLPGAPVLFNQLFLPDGSAVSTGVHNEWAAKIGGGYRVNDGIGDLQFYAYYEWMRREVLPFEQPFNERSRDGVYASVTQFIGKQWSVSASYAHAFKTPGNPACLSLNNSNAAIACVADGTVNPVVQIGQYQANLFDDSASQYSIGARYYFNQWASWYVVGTYLTQGPGAHYCLGASGHGYQICSRDAANDTIGGASLKAASTGMTFNF
ncbi:porin [Bradyrhizobium sp. NP1]|uniref:porin n=1 Tax=Bradyrhizobium sp. NP1 TaxID=3049772 RepID=UPI0025A63D0C|nr:porin [Bradyrhizobium sp. NP1]WJR80799.1 porin [Bradyrhizobium sp. NP1]